MKSKMFCYQDVLHKRGQNATYNYRNGIFYKNLSAQFVLFLIILINVIFAYKYISRYSNYSIIISIGYALFLYFVSNYLLNGGSKWVANKVPYLIAGYVICIIIILAMTDPMKIRVDRWSVITAFWDGVRNGIFPYQVKSHMGCHPGPFPAYFILALPFYFIGEIGYFSLSGFLLMIYNTYYYFKGNLNNKITTIFLLISSLAILWELTVRSTILINSALIALYLIWLLRNDRFNFLHIAVLGAVGGLALSTRGIFILPFVSVIAYYFLKPLRIRELIIYSIFLILSFSITFVPLLLWNIKLFIKYNPITLQSGLIGLNIAIILAIISLAIGFIVKNESQLFLGIGAIMYLAATIYFFEKLKIYGLTTNFIQNSVDISYFIFAIPFLLLSL